MKVEVRYYSRSGNTKALAEAIAKGCSVSAISVDSEDAEIKNKVDVLFIGGALYAYGLDNNLKNYLKNIDGSKVEKAVVFSTSWLSKHSITLIKKALEEKNIKVEEEYFYAKGKPSDKYLDDVKKMVKKYM